jgi:TRAP-type uncharacterized transport system fused permease subunit
LDDLINQFLPLGVAIISILAFIVSLITELIKNIGFLKKVPTNIVVLVLSVIICVISYLAYSSYKEYTVYWYSVVASIFSGFVVAYIATYGWEKFHLLFERFKRSKEDKSIK